MWIDVIRFFTSRRLAVFRRKLDADGSQNVFRHHAACANDGVVIRNQLGAARLRDVNMPALDHINQRSP